MPKRTDIKKVMIIGSGPIVIGQAAEFDYSGSQACKSVQEEGYKTVLVNSNPATIQTDLEMADAVYVEPLTWQILEKIIKKERPDGILSGMGGQTALNLCSELAENGVLEKYTVELLGTPLKSIEDSEDREKFRAMMERIKEPIPYSKAVNTLEDAKKIQKKIGRYPVIIRAAYTLGGTGSGIAHDDQEFETIVAAGINASRINQVLVEEGVLGWKEFEYEVMRDSHDNCITICNMENLDAMGIHTGESIVVAPAQTLSDEDHQKLRTAALKIIRALNIQGGCNIQFAVNTETGDYIVIEVNPRVSRSSALASKATGYPIARVAAKIACGLTLDEIPNAVTKNTYAAFEPALDYVVLKIPRWPFDKFRTVNPQIGTQMKSTGEVMSIGRTMEESILKAIRSLDVDRVGLELDDWSEEMLLTELKYPTDMRLCAIAECLRRDWPAEKIIKLTAWDSFFVDKLKNLVDLETGIYENGYKDNLAELKKNGFSDEYISMISEVSEEEISDERKKQSVRPTFKMVDTCAAEFEATTPYYYSTYEGQDEGAVSERKKVLIIGSGPIRIGQGIEFDCCCCHGVMALREEKVEAIIINNNPETMSTDFDISDKLYFEPLTKEDVINIINKEQPDGVIVQFGGQTSVNLAVPLEKELQRTGNTKTKILGTTAASIDLAENRQMFEELMTRLNIRQPKAGTGYSFAEVKNIAHEIGFPVVVRPSYVLGGRGMEIVYNEADLEFYMTRAVKVSRKHPVLVDKYLEHAIEIDVDALCDGKDVLIGGIMEHIEEAGVHSGDAAMVIPPQTQSKEMMEKIRDVTRNVALALNTIGLINMQLAIKDGDVYVLEANPRASRTVPFVSKAIGVPLAKVATKIMLGKSLKEQGLTKEVTLKHIAVKESVFPFRKLPGVDSILGPEMKSTGEVMGIDTSFPLAFYKSQLAAGTMLPDSGGVFITVRRDDRDKILPIVRKLNEMKYDLLATKGTAEFLAKNGIKAGIVYRISEKEKGGPSEALELMRAGKISLIINTPSATSGATRDGYLMRRSAVELNIPYITTIEGAGAAVDAIEYVKSNEPGVKSLQEYAADNMK